MTLTAADIVEDALSIIGVLSVYDTAPEPEHYKKALRIFDQMVAQLAATKALWFFDSGAVRIPLVAGQTEYDLDAILSEDIQLVRDAFLLTNDGNQSRRRIKLLRQYEYDDRMSDKGNAAYATEVYIPRSTTPIMYVIPATNNSAFQQTIELRGQKYTADLTKNNGQVFHGFEKPWELMLGYGLAKYLGSGPIVTLDSGRLTEIKTEYQTMLNDLVNNRPGRENVRAGRFVKTFGA